MGKSAPMVILTKVILSLPLHAGDAVQREIRDVYMGKKHTLWFN